MESDGECKICQALRDEASAAINRHLQATDRYELARLRHEADLIPALEVVLKEAALKREWAVMALKNHMQTHRKAC